MLWAHDVLQRPVRVQRFASEPKVDLDDGQLAKRRANRKYYIRAKATAAAARAPFAQRERERERRLR